MYSVRNENKKLPVKVNNNLSLFDACFKIVQKHGGLVLQNGKLIAFWCSYHNRVKAGFGANEYEKTQVKNFLL